ncbi:PREDICTED: uncharacterized protein LOC104822633 [Tarenaya hassleriana]|uniref:uncharacterized protein LOC104822633 n=1 Tax=Tarenaya hassleriana TaxID=28532 RepID=UPI00053C57DB|nr:PREDICTED: uncharacterized protein LOC104822633 [Tarenaya hassleriana]
MSEEGPKLSPNKPKKAQLKQAQAKAKDFTTPPSSSMSSTAAAASYSMRSQGGSVPPPPPPKEPFARRYKFLWPLLLTVNLAIGGYILLRTKKKDTSPTDEETAPPSTQSTDAAVASVDAQKTPALAVVTEPVKAREPIPVKEQRDLFKWMLEEKRKANPKGAEEKKKIDEEKEMLKQLIRAKTIPNL